MFKLASGTFFVFAFFLTSCSSSPEVNERPLPKSKSQYTGRQAHQPGSYNDIDVNELIVELGLDHPIEDIGYQERAFNTCDVEANHSSNPRCQTYYASRVNFQIMCRESTGTVESVRLTPFYSGKLRWKSSGQRGSAFTNGEGFGQVAFVSNRSNFNSHLYLYLGAKVARKRFRDQWKLILPKSWCLNQ